MAGAVTLALFALAGLFVAMGPRLVTAQSTGGQSTEQAPALQAQTPVLAPQAPEQPQAADLTGQYRIIGWNDLGMHCMNESFANLAVLPPYNTLWAQVIRQGPTPEIVTSGVTVEYSIIDNTYSVGKTDFWQYAKQLFGADLAPNVGLTGATLAGQMHITGDHFAIEGLPLTPYRDSAPQPGPQNWYPYQLAKLIARDSITGQVLAETTTVAPVSTEMRCDTCHADGMQEGIRTGNVETNILTLHDKEEGTNLMGSRPVLCAGCHGSNALGAPGKPGIPNLSRAMHKRHAPEGRGCGFTFAGGHPGVDRQRRLDRQCQLVSDSIGGSERRHQQLLPVPSRPADPVSARRDVCEGHDLHQLSRRHRRRGEFGPPPVDR